MRSNDAHPSMADPTPAALLWGLEDGGLWGHVLQQDRVSGTQSMGWFCTVLLGGQPIKCPTAGPFVMLSGYLYSKSSASSPVKGPLHKDGDHVKDLLLKTFKNDNTETLLHIILITCW